MKSIYVILIYFFSTSVFGNNNKPDLNTFRIAYYEISVDCDGDGEWDFMWQGYMDSSHVSAMVSQLMNSCD